MSRGKRLLAAYLKRLGKGAASDLARRMGVARSLVSQWVRGTRSPSGKNSRRLEEATGGAVPGKSWDEPEEVARPRRGRKSNETVVSSQPA